MDMIDQQLGSTNRTGVWFFRLDVNPVLDLPAKRCYDWYKQQANVTIPTLPPCPCQFNQAVLDKRFFVDYSKKWAVRSNQTVCAYPLVTSGWVQQCCYTEIPGSGKLLALGVPEGGSPFLIKQIGYPGITELQARDYCCRSSLCGLYYRLRPSQTCAGYTLRQRGKKLPLILKKFEFSLFTN